ncbi:hypothetical protein AZI86_12565 [Bdellovibrio bacteriovorus]|uniref:Uncharacterized protein n=1 Tax=Bdellovibrio bacteriovorus TaxID=959 RepID=A0A150WIP0_BDEBC|nr:hypothetical protein [Bdellovibrio bacteriovorus]KYG63657.1 hypothetical protein AZI86_12565 [Bdellovibrio bacteriovorus]
MKALLLVILVLGALSGNAAPDPGGGGGTVGNGGDVVVCPALNTVLLLDIYEADKLRGFKLSLGSSELTVKQKIQIAIARLKRLDPVRASTVDYNANTFFKEAKFISGIALRDVEDSLEPFLPAGCHKEQIAIQNAKVVPEDPFYVVNAELWEKLDNDNQAALVIHEAIFRAARGTWSSSLVRLLNSAAFSDRFDNLPVGAYYKFMSGTELASTVKAVYAGNDVWYYQLEEQWNFRHFFSLPRFENSADIGVTWERACGFTWGKPITPADLPVMKDLVQNNYGTPETVPVWVQTGEANAQPFWLSLLAPVQSVLQEAKYQVWCKGAKFPY